MVAEAFFRVGGLTRVMSLFRKVGRTVERTKRSLVGDGEAAFVCESCDRVVEEAYEFCPHCGEPTVEPVD